MSSDRKCSEGCQCINCHNNGVIQPCSDELSLEEEMQMPHHCSDDLENIEEVMDWIFGPEICQENGDSEDL